MFLERYREVLNKARFILRFTENFAILVSRASGWALSRVVASPRRFSRSRKHSLLTTVLD